MTPFDPSELGYPYGAVAADVVSSIGLMPTCTVPEIALLVPVRSCAFAKFEGMLCDAVGQGLLWQVWFVSQMISASFPFPRVTLQVQTPLLGEQGVFSFAW